MTNGIPERLRQDRYRIPALLEAAEHELLCRRAEIEDAKARVRRLRRCRRRVRRYRLRRAGLAALSLTLVVLGIAAFAIGAVLFVMGEPSGIALFGTAGTAWGMAAALSALPSGR